MLGFTSKILGEVLIPTMIYFEPGSQVSMDPLILTDSIKNSWDDVSCSKVYCPVCIIPKLLKFVLRGLCPNSLLDTHYASVSYTHLTLPTILLV